MEIKPPIEAPPVEAPATNVEAEKAQQDKPGERFKPLPEGAKLDERLRHMEMYFYGSIVNRDSKRENQVVKYLLFCVPSIVQAKLEKSKGRWEPTLWREAIMKVPDRRERMAFIELTAESMDKVDFISWAVKTVNDVFGGAE